MRIAICTDQYLPLLSGLVDSIETLAASLRARGHVVRIYTAKFPGAVPEPDVFHFPAHVSPNSGGAVVITFPRGGIRDIKRFKPDVIHTHMFGVVGFFALYAGWRLNVPVVGTDHTSPADYLHYAGLDFKIFRFLIRSFSSWFYGRTVAVSAPSEHILDELEEYGMRGVHREVISNAVKLDLFRPLQNKEELRKKYGITSPSVLLFGRIALEKNLDFAVDVFAELVKTKPAQLVILGDGPYRGALEKKIKDSGVESKTKFLGVLRGEALVEALNAADVFFTTSISEIQPMATLQAMAIGLPAVAARAGGLPECVIDDSTGYLVEPTNKNTYVEKLKMLLTDPLLRENFGKAGREAVQGYYPERIAQKFEHLYERAQTLAKNPKV